MLKSQITTIIFDLAEVYLKGLLGIGEVLEPILKMDKDKIQSSFRGNELTEFFHGNFSEEKYLSFVIKKNKWNLDVIALKKVIRDNFIEIDGTREIIESLRKNGYKLGLLSVHSREWVDYCNQKFDFHKLFHSIVYSFEFGISKPDERSYKLILKKLKVCPNECLFIDDQEKNLIPAKKLGINVILFKTPHQLKNDILKLGIKC